MKDGVLDVLIYLFENYIADELSFDPDQEELTEELEGAGFPSIEIDKAFAWLEDLLDACEADHQDQAHMPAHDSIRFYDEKELASLGRQGIKLLNRFIDAGVLNYISREMVIDRVMALDSNKVGIDHIRWVVLMVLSNQPGFDEISAWAEVVIAQEKLPVCLLYTSPSPRD